ncbi:MAG: 50S ribosomal protein L25 [bacterium]|nr:50S ribosomal protein L25 [bacterium]
MTYSIDAEVRTQTGRQATAVRNADRIPAVVYGHGIEATSISVPRSAFVKTYKLAGYSSLVDLNMSGSAPVKVVIKEVQLEPIKNIPVHVDFYQVRMDEEMTATVPFKFVGESDAVKTAAGTLIKSMDEIEVTCLPADLPAAIEVDLSALKTFEDAITIGNLVMPKGVVAAGDASLTIATVARPLTEDELKKLEEASTGDVSAIKTEGEEKKAEEEAKKAEEAAADDATKKDAKK